MKYYVFVLIPCFYSTHCIYFLCLNSTVVLSITYSFEQVYFNVHNKASFLLNDGIVVVKLLISVNDDLLLYSKMHRRQARAGLSKKPHRRDKTRGVNVAAILHHQE